MQLLRAETVLVANEIFPAASICILDSGIAVFPAFDLSAAAAAATTRFDSCWSAPIPKSGPNIQLHLHLLYPPSYFREASEDDHFT
jgi:hypothetical protein